MPELAAVFLLDTSKDRVLKLTETGGDVLHAGFDEARPGVIVGTRTDGPPEAQVLYRFDLDGTVIDQREWPARGVVGDFARCAEIRSVYEGPGAPPPIVEVDGKRFENVNCGAISPDDRWMTYWLWAEGTSLASAPTRIDQWILDLTTGDRRLLQRDLVHCGGCDSVPSPKWSPSSGYVYFSDVVAGGDRFFLADVTTGTVRQLTEHVPKEPFDTPAWSPTRDVLLRSDRLGANVMERMTDGSSTVLAGVPWPARFDPSGTYVYSPAWYHEQRRDATVVFDLASSAIRARLPGHPAQRVYIGTGGPPIDQSFVLGIPDGFVAALLEAPGCAGVAIYRNDALLTCVSGAIAALFSPDGSKVALIRATGKLETTARCLSCVVVETVIVDTVSGREANSASRSIRVLIDPEYPGGITHAWNEDGTHLLVTGLAAP